MHHTRLDLLRVHHRRGELLIRAQNLPQHVFGRMLQAHHIALSEVVLCIALVERWEQVCAAAQWRHRQGLATPATPTEALNAVSDWQCLLH